MNNIMFSIVVPMFNEQDMAEAFHVEASRVLRDMGAPYEIIYVDDGSRDRTPEILSRFKGTDPNVRVLEFSRNFGHQAAMTAGLDHALGRAVVIMDGDLQDPPSLLPAMASKWKEGFDVVYARRRSRKGESFFKRLTAHLFYRLLRSVTGIDLPVDTGDFRLMDRKVVDALKAMPERRRFLRGLVSWAGFRQTGVSFDRPARSAGTTKFSLWKMMKFALDGITSFSIFPLRLVTFMGIGCFMASLCLIGWALHVRFFTDNGVPGWTSLIGVILFLGGIQLLSLGVIGEYLARVFEESKHRPLYLVKGKS